MPRYLLPLVAALASAALLATVAGPARSQAAPGPRHGIEALWSEYPLDPKPRDGVFERRRLEAPSRPEQAKPLDQPRPRPVDDRVSMDLTFGIAFFGTLGLALVVVLLTKLVGFGRSSDDLEVSPRQDLPPHPSELPSGVLLAQVYTPTSEGGSPAVKETRESNAKRERRPPEAAATEGAAEAGHDYALLGEQVTAVLTSADEAATEIRQAARRAADQILADAENEAKAARAEAEEMRADADAYAQQTRAAADELATRVRSELEEETHAVRAEAERKANEIEAEALRRRELLEETAEHLEERIAGMLSTFRGLTADLEELVRPERRQEEGEPPPAADEVVGDDALEDSLKPERAASR